MSAVEELSESISQAKDDIASLKLAKAHVVARVNILNSEDGRYFLGELKRERDALVEQYDRVSPDSAVSVASLQGEVSRVKWLVKIIEGSEKELHKVNKDLFLMEKRLSDMISHMKHVEESGGEFVTSETKRKLESNNE